MLPERIYQVPEAPELRFRVEEDFPGTGTRRRPAKHAKHVQVRYSVGHQNRRLNQVFFGDYVITNLSCSQEWDGSFVLIKMHAQKGESVAIKLPVKKLFRALYSAHDLH